MSAPAAILEPPPAAHANDAHAPRADNTAAPPRTAPDQAHALLAALLSPGADLPALLTRLNLSAADLLALSRDPAFAAQLQDVRTLVESCLSIQSAAARSHAVAVLAEVARTSDDPIERRRAASAVLRATNPRPPTPTTPPTPRDDARRDDSCNITTAPDATTASTAFRATTFGSAKVVPTSSSSSATPLGSAQAAPVPPAPAASTLPLHALRDLRVEDPRVPPSRSAPPPRPLPPLPDNLTHPDPRHALRALRDCFARASPRDPLRGLRAVQAMRDDATPLTADEQQQLAALCPRTDGGGIACSAPLSTATQPDSAAAPDLELEADLWLRCPDVDAPARLSLLLRRESPGQPWRIARHTLDPPRPRY